MGDRSAMPAFSAARPGPSRPSAAWLGGLVLVALVAGPGCASLAEHRKLEFEVNKLKRQVGDVGPEDTVVADLRGELEAVREEVASLRGQVQEAEHRAEQALEQARAARQAAAQAAPGEAGEAGGTDAVPPGGTDGEPGASEELAAYRSAYEAWRTDAHQACIDRFREFLQAYPSSRYADDAAYWMADCYFKQGDFQTAILRFDDVVSRHPASPKAPQALFRQGEALMRLGPRYSKAAEKAFERVIDEYPDSTRAREAARQLELLGSG